MNIQNVYSYQKPLIERYFADFYNKFAKDIDKDSNFELADDEVSELFNELILMYMRDTMHKYEWVRITKLLKQ